MKATAANLSVKVGALVHPTRLAVTGSNAGPSLYHLLEILGKEKVMERIDRALCYVHSRVCLCYPLSECEVPRRLRDSG